MADLLRVVTLSAGGRPVTVLDLDNGTDYYRERGTFTFTPGAPQVQQSRLARRYGGGKTVGVTHDNGQINWTVVVHGAASADAAALKVETLLREIETAARTRRVEWRPEGMSYSSFFRLAGPGAWTPKYAWQEFANGGFMRCDVTFPVLPLVEWAPMSVRDDFSVNSLADYTFDAGAAGNVTVTGGALDAVANLTTENRMIHTARGYDYAGAQATLKATPGVTIASFKAGVILKRTAANNYVEVYVDDNATNSRLRVDQVIAGVRTNVATTNLAARVVSATPFWVRGRCEGTSVVAEYFTAAPTPMGTPTLTNNGAVAGISTGAPGIVWTPQHTNATVDDFQVRSFAKRNVTLPATISLPDIPGTAPAAVDVTVTPSGGSAAPVWAMIGWAPTVTALVGGATVPFGVLEAESAGDLAGWVSAADAGSRGGNRLYDTTVSGAESYTASWTIDPNPLAADAFTDGELSLEVWAVMVLATTLVSPKATLSVRPVDGLNYGTERFSNEHGSVGKLLTVPSSGTAVRRPVRLGTVTVPVDPLRPRAVKLWLGASTAAGSTGAFGVDYLWMVPARARALSPTAKPLDTAFPSFVASTNQTSKIVRSDLSGGVSLPPADPHPDHGLGGSLLELPAGDVDVLVKLSSLVPDDSTASSTGEQLAHSGSVEFDVTPRSFMLRSV